MGKKINHIENLGKKFNRLEVLEIIKKGKDYYYKCKCDCGTIKDIRAAFVVNGITKSCGCLFKEVRKKQGKIMGLNNRKYDKCSYCGNKHYAKGYCRRCYARFLRNGTSEYKNYSKYRKRGE